MKIFLNTYLRMYFYIDVYEFFFFYINLTIFLNSESYYIYSKRFSNLKKKTISKIKF